MVEEFIKTNDVEGFTKYIEGLSAEELSDLYDDIFQKYEDLSFQDDMINMMDAQPLNGGDGTMPRRWVHESETTKLSNFMHIVLEKLNSKRHKM